MAFEIRLCSGLPLQIAQIHANWCITPKHSQFVQLKFLM